MHFRLIMLSLVFQLSITGISQIDNEYQFGFDFVEGIYITYDDFINNRPAITQYRVIVKNDVLYDNFTNERVIKQLQGCNKYGLWIDIDENDAWGICHDDRIYVYVDKAFHEITKIGALMYITIAFKGQYDVLSFSSGDTYVGPAKKTEITRYLIDFETGEYYLFNLKNFAKLIKKDKELYDEFKAIIGKKKKKHHMIMYLEKFNERNPVSFPANPY